MLLELLNRRRNFMLTGVHLAANLLDPVLKGGHLSRAENRAAIQFISSVVPSESVYEELASFQNALGPWEDTFLENIAKSTSAFTFWKNYAPEGSCLTPIATKLSFLAASSSATERTFSIYGITHSKLRNRLLTENASKYAASKTRKGSPLQQI